jgi:hypothetical protein
LMVGWLGVISEKTLQVRIICAAAIQQNVFRFHDNNQAIEPSSHPCLKTACA